MTYQQAGHEHQHHRRDNIEQPEIALWTLVHQFMRVHKIFIAMRGEFLSADADQGVMARSGF